MLQPAHCSVFQLVVFILLYFSKLYFMRREVLEKNNRAQHVCVRRPWNLAADVFIIHHIMSVSRHVEAEHSKLASIKPNLKPKVTRLSSVSERVCVDCGRTGGHSFCQMERDWWSGLERWPGVFSYSNGKEGDSWPQYIGLCVCMCAYFCSTVYMTVFLEMHCIVPETTEDVRPRGAWEAAGKYCLSVNILGCH